MEYSLGEKILFTKPVPIGHIDGEKELDISVNKKLMEIFLNKSLEEEKALPPKDLIKEMPIYVVNEYATKRTLKSTTTIPYIYEKDVRWAMKAKGSTILKVSYELALSNSPLFLQAIKCSYFNLSVEEKLEYHLSETEFMQAVIKEFGGREYGIV